MLWTDVIDPATLTGYARASLADYEKRKGTLARFLPNRVVADTVVRFVQGATGLVDIADFRAYDAEPTIGKGPSGKRVTLELPALGQNIPISEYNQLRLRNASNSDAAALQGIQNTTDNVVRAVADAIEWQRGVVLETGIATVPGFMADDFGRSGSHSVSASTVWSDVTADIIGMVQSWVDTYTDDNGEAPGCALTSTRVARAIAKANQFKTALLSGASRPANLNDVNDTLVGEGLPPLVLFDRRIQKAGTKQKVISDDKFILLPAPVDPNDPEGTDLGATTWGQTLTSLDPDWSIEDTEQPGLVAGVYRNPKPPMIAEVIGDAIGMAHLANADLSFVADVL
jgi:hypothetical protein